MLGATMKIKKKKSPNYFDIRINILL